MKKTLPLLLSLFLLLPALTGSLPERASAEGYVNTFVSDGTYTYYYQADGTPMTNRLTYHPDGVHVIYFDEYGHEVFDSFHQVTTGIAGDSMGSDAYCYFDTFGHMYTNTVTYDSTGTKLYYINPYGLLEHTGWFSFYDGAGYGNSGLYWTLNATRRGYANYDGTLLCNQNTYDEYGQAVYMQANGEAVKISAPASSDSSSGGSSSGGSGIDSDEIVYWTDSGKCYHSTDACRTLSRSRNIQSGPLRDCPKSEPCSICY